MCCDDRQQPNQTHDEPLFDAGCLPIVDLHRVLEQAGVLVPESVTIVGDPRSRAGARIDASSVRVLSDVRLIPHEGQILAMKANDSTVSGTFNCKCENGTGGCSALTSEDPMGNPGIACDSTDCTGHCKLFVKVPEDRFNLYALRACGCDVGDDASIVGDITSPAGALVIGRNVKVRENSGSRLVRLSRSSALLMSGQNVKGSFKCKCSAGSGSCGLAINGTVMVCTPEAGCTSCDLVVRIPGLHLAYERAGGM